MSQPIYQEIHHCRLCGGTDLIEAINIGDQALSGCFPGPGDEDPPVAPLIVIRCGDCGLVQLRHSVNTDAMFTYDYGYRSGINATMRDHLAGVVEWTTERCPVGAGDIVVDIGCNDGTLLKSYKMPGLERMGIDAIAGKFKDEIPDGIQVTEGFFTIDLAHQLFAQNKAKIITSIAMFYDLEQPGDFVAAIADTLAGDGVWVLEQSYLPTMLETNAFDTICHEHLEFYGLEQIDRLASMHELRVFDVQKNAINGGSFRIAVCHDNAPYETSDAVTNLRAQEAELGLNTAVPYAAFQKKINELRDDLKIFVEAEIAKGKKIYAYGASTKGNTLFQFYGLDHRHIVAVADRNPEKWGRRTPQTRIPIVSEQTARADSPDYFLVLPWHFRDEFVKREAAFLERGGKFIFPLPNFEVV